MPRKRGVPPKRDTRKRPTSIEIGRPSEYLDSYPEMLIKHMGEGKSFASFAGTIGKSFETLYDWINDKSPRYKVDFSEAKKVGDALSLAYCEDIGMRGISGRLARVTSLTTKKDENGKTIEERRELAPATFAQSAWIFLMKNRFPGQYRDRYEQGHGLLDADGKAMTPTKVIIAIPRNGSEAPCDSGEDDG